ncbi:MAG: Cof-type HAD-IIB family hydrolase [Treponema sp.]|jgi:Cof subfamily protein (haloacid dehalogenase superfamily)|nr:Cof-type HAD-IIB family hydrolase [Treponema sp.]
MSISIDSTIDPNRIKALALDLDGTLLAPGAVLSGRTLKAIHACRQRGLKIIIATGRAIDAAELFRVSLDAEGPMIYFNGAVVMDMPERKILTATLLDKEAVEFCVDLSRETGIYYQVYFPGNDADPRIVLMAEKDGPEREMYHKHTGLLAELGDIKETLRRPGVDGCVKTMFLSEPEVLDSLRVKLDRHFGESAYIARTLATFQEVMNKNVSKGRGLAFVMERLSLRPEEVIAFGDEENDVPMFEAAGFSAAPLNAKESVKAKAGMNIGSNAEDGVAVFLEELFGL